MGDKTQNAHAPGERVQAVSMKPSKLVCVGGRAQQSQELAEKKGSLEREFKVPLRACPNASVPSALAAKSNTTTFWFMVAHIQHAMCLSSAQLDALEECVVGVRPCVGVVFQVSDQFPGPRDWHWSVLGCS